MTLTRAGELLADHGRAILVRLRAAKVDIVTASSNEQLTIHARFRAGVAPWLVRRLLVS